MPNIRPYKLHHDDLGFLVCRNCGRRIEIGETGLRHVGNGQRLCSSVGEKAEHFRAEPLHIGDAVRFLVSPVSGRLKNPVMTCFICGVRALRAAGDELPLAAHFCRTLDDGWCDRCLCMECTKPVPLEDIVVHMFWLDCVPIRWCGHRACLEPPNLDARAQW